MIGIYCYRNRENGMCYVGQSIDIAKRNSEHFSGKDTDNMYIDRAIAKHGKDAFVVEVLELCKEDVLDNRECHWIATLNCMSPYGYNLRSGGSRGRLSDETKRKISEGLKGREVSAETRQKISDAHRGRKHSDAVRKNMAKSQIGKTLSLETRRKISEANRGRKHSLETRQKLSEIHKGRKKAPFSDEHKQKISESSRGRKASPEARAKMSEKAKARFANPENHPNFGKKHSLETRQKISDAHKGEKHRLYGKNIPDETKQRMSESQKARRRREKHNPLQLRLFDD